MKRRALLTTAAAAAAGLAGCTDADGLGDGGGTPTASPTRSTPTDSPPNGTDALDGSDGGDGGDTGDTPTDSPTPTPAETTVTESSLEVLETGCGSGDHAATAEYDNDHVDVEGTIRGSDTCYTAELESARYDEASDELVIAVRAYRPDDAEACGQCIVDVDYRATVNYDGPAPGAAVVRHDGREVERTQAPE